VIAIVVGPYQTGQEDEMFCSAIRWIRDYMLLAVLVLVPACNGSMNPNSPTNAPSFGGATSATAGPSSGEVTLTWSPALDVSGGTITYFVFASLSGSGSEDMSNPVASTTNATGVTVTGLVSHDPYVFIVQAMDTSGHSDGNTVEVSATPP
jgi:hypothetical protein